MTGRVQTLRSNVAGNRPAGRAPGELYVNWPDRQLGVVDSTSTAVDLVAVRFFSSTTTYSIGDFVLQGGQLYRAIAASSPGAFVPANWSKIGTAQDLSSYLLLTGGTLTGPLILAADPSALLGAATKQYTDTGDATTRTYVDGKFLPLAGGTLTGPLTAAAATFGGALTVSGAAATARNLYGATGASQRWRLTLGNGAAESGSNAGSDFAIGACDDTGALLNNGFQINRANCAVNIVGVGGAPWSGTVGATPGNAQLFINKSSGNFSAQLCSTNAGSLRWRITLADGSSETGSNQGSIFTIDRFSDAGASLGAILTSGRAGGVVTFTSAIVNGPSDRRLKENIAPIEGALDKVLALQGVSFDMLATPNKREIGLIAQDVEPVVPEVLQAYETTGPDGKSTGPYLALDYPKLTALLIEAVKELTARVVQLEALRAGLDEGNEPTPATQPSNTGEDDGPSPAPRHSASAADRSERGTEHSRSTKSAPGPEPTRSDRHSAPEPEPQSRGPAAAGSGRSDPRHGSTVKHGPASHGGPKRTGR